MAVIREWDSSLPWLDPAVVSGSSRVFLTVPAAVVVLVLPDWWEHNFGDL